MHTICGIISMDVLVFIVSVNAFMLSNIYPTAEVCIVLLFWYYYFSCKYLEVMQSGEMIRMSLRQAADMEQ